MNIYKNQINRFPNFQRKNNLNTKQKPIHKSSVFDLDDFVGKYEAFEPINSLDLKEQFKKGEI